MRFTNLRNNAVTISRMTALSGGTNHTTTVTAGIPVTIQKANVEKTSLAGGVFGKMYTMYCDWDVDIRDGDKLLDQDGFTYKVKTGGITKEEMGAYIFQMVIIERVG